MLTTTIEPRPPLPPSVDAYGVPLYQPNDPYHFDFDNKPIKTLAIRDQILSVQINQNTQILRDSAGSIGSLPLRLDQSLSGDGNLKTEAVDQSNHSIAHHSNGNRQISQQEMDEYNSLGYMLNPEPDFVVMLKAERDKLSRITADANNITFKFPGVESPVDGGMIELQDSYGIYWEVSNPSDENIVIKPILNNATDHKHFYEITPIFVNGQYQISGVQRFKKDTLRVYVNGVRIPSCSQSCSAEDGVYCPGFSSNATTPPPQLKTPNTQWNNLYFTEISEEAKFTLSSTLSSYDKIFVDYEIEVIQSATTTTAAPSTTTTTTTSTTTLAPFNPQSISVSDVTGDYPSSTTITMSNKRLSITSDGDPYPAKAGIPLVNDGSSAREFTPTSIIISGGDAVSNGLNGTYSLARTLDANNHIFYSKDGLNSYPRIALSINLDAPDNTYWALAESSESDFDYYITDIVYPNPPVSTNWLEGDLDFSSGGVVSESGSVIKDQEYNFSFTYRGGLNTDNPQDTSLGAMGIAVNGVVLLSPVTPAGPLPGGTDMPAAGFQFDMVFNNSSLNVDSCGGIPDINGVYGYRDGSFLKDCWSTNKFYGKNTYYSGSAYLGDHFRHEDGHSKIIGFCMDGYPVYGPYGYPIDYNGSKLGNNGGQLLSSYRTYATEKSGRGYSYDEYPAGSFVQDYYYFEARDYHPYPYLDEHNGRYCVTPEYPNGTYAYFLTFKPDDLNTPTYPYIFGPKTKQTREAGGDTQNQGPGPRTYYVNITSKPNIAYTLSGTDRNGAISGDNPSIQVLVGDTLVFNISAPGYPAWLKRYDVTGSGSDLSLVNNNGADSGAIAWTPSLPGTYYYIAENSFTMHGSIIVTSS